ncbi:hypothetical protein NP233_g12512 [Leucocoprinus birnbaumii]|uniref:NAD(P)-binding protein n=1 Tax=Leucocoprinus birnbaumii TaxID=56174 RepID=A0AAD5VEW9_9AGAR|nr:hypothetical protein NP233_g12512 [Leucocoprinus birnbaumii]
MAKLPVWSSLYQLLRISAPLVKADLKGKTVVVVGANTGIGFETAQHFATMGPKRLILACRSQERGEAAIQRLKQATGCDKAELWLIDLADFLSVKAFADRALSELERIDIIVMSAGIRTRKYNTTKDGWETSLQVNYLSMSLLALWLLPRLSETATRFNIKPRIVVVTSGVHFSSRFEDEIFEAPNAFSLLSSEDYCTPNMMRARYHETKLLNVFFVRALKNHLKDKSIIVNAADPGFCHSELRREITSIGLSIYERLFAMSAEAGSRNIIWASIGTPEGGNEDDMSGQFIMFASIQEPADSVLGQEGKRREDKLWNDLISILRDVDPRILDIDHHLN